MDLCCLIDSEDRLPATDLVNMLGDLFARGMSWSVVNTTMADDLLCRDEVPHQTLASCSNTNREVVLRPEARVTIWHCLRYRIREQTGSGEYQIANVLCYDRSHACAHHGLIL
jgi:hypothetical protein